MNIVLNHIKLLRPFNVFISGFAIIIASAILDELYNFEKLIFILLTVMFFTGAANVYNDYVDYEIDLINRPRRPLPSGGVKKKSALLLSFFLFMCGSYFCFNLNQAAKIIGVLISMPLIILYSKMLKGLPLIGNIVTSLILGLSFIFCGVAFDNVKPMLIPSFLAFGLTLTRELIKDIADVKGDKLCGLNTFPIYAGIDKSCKLAIIFSITIFITSLIPFISGYYGFWYVLLLVLGVEIPLLVVVFLLNKKPGVSSAMSSAKILKFSTLIGLFSIYGGTFK
jgi:geranylgeranylglycerol-phosphate geranylgeranyltransferase